MLFSLLTTLAYGADTLTHEFEWRPAGYAVAGLLFALSFGVAGRRLRTGRRSGAWVAVPTAVISSLALVASQPAFNVDAPATIVLVVNLFLIGLVLAHWRSLSRG